MTVKIEVILEGTKIAEWQRDDMGHLLPPNNATGGQSRAEGANLTAVLERTAAFDPEGWPIQMVNDKPYLTVPEQFVLDSVELAKTMLRSNVNSMS